MGKACRSDASSVSLRTVVGLCTSPFPLSPYGYILLSTSSTHFSRSEADLQRHGSGPHTHQTYSDGAMNVGLGTPATSGGIKGQNITHKAENALTKKQITYEFGAKPDSNELRAGSTSGRPGYRVKYKTTASDKGLQNVRTQDLGGDGVGKVYVYTPFSTKPKSIINTIEKKDSQTSSVITQIDLTGEEMSGIASKAWGKPNIKNINTLFFQCAQIKCIDLNVQKQEVTNVKIILQMWVCYGFQNNGRKFFI